MSVKESDQLQYKSRQSRSPACHSMIFGIEKVKKALVSVVVLIKQFSEEGTEIIFQIAKLHLYDLALWIHQYIKRYAIGTEIGI